MNIFCKNIGKIMKKICILAPLVLTAVSCTSINVKEVNGDKNAIEPICIKTNPKVIIPDFLSVLKDGIKQHNLTVKIADETYYDCKSILTYTALRSWDVTPYLSHAELRLKNLNGEEIGSATYHHNGGGMSLSPNKWNSDKSKVLPVIDQLFSGVK